MYNYDYVIVGAGLFGSICAFELKKRGFSCLVIDKRNHIGGNCYTEEIERIQIHKYGAHIFRTSDKKIWEYVQQFADFNNFINAPLANYHGEIYNLPFNMNTFNRMWGVVTPAEAKSIIQEQRVASTNVIKNLEEYAIDQVGIDIYNKLIREYTEKQWGRKCKDLPISIMKRIPIRFTYNNNYYLDRYQGVPIGGYTQMFEKMLVGVDIELEVNFCNVRNKYLGKNTVVIYTGPIDEYFEYQFGALEYRSLRFEHEILNMDNYQGVAVVNYTDIETPYTRIIEHKFFEDKRSDKTVISREYPLEWQLGIEPYYPINDEKNQQKFLRYMRLAENEKNILFSGRLGAYKYTDMQETVKMALELIEKILK